MKCSQCHEEYLEYPDPQSNEIYLTCIQCHTVYPITNIPADAVTIPDPVSYASNIADYYPMEKKLRKALFKIREYVDADPHTQAVIYQIVNFCRKRGFKYQIFDRIVFIHSFAGTWWFDYCTDVIRLKHQNWRGDNTQYHAQGKYNGVMEALNHIDWHDTNIYKWQPHRRRRAN